ncbi:MAG: glycosyltransferase [Akkermansiaceae bacterium]|nr:glycosyltransferase [Armatimonadota bacterium]
MRVGLFTESFDPVINGVSTSVKTLACEMAKSGHTSLIVAPEYPGFTDEARDLPEGVVIRRIPSWRIAVNPENPFAFPPVPFLPVPEAYRDEEMDVVHTQQPFGLGLHGRVAARRANIPLVSTFHTLYLEYAHYVPVVPKAITRSIATRYLAGYYNTCAAVVTPSRVMRDLLTSLGVPAERLHVVPTGIPLAPVVLPTARDRVRETFNIPPFAPILLFVGRLAAEKNLDALLAAFALISEAHPVPSPETHPFLLFVGSGPYRERCERRARDMGLEVYVRFAGFLSRQQLAPIYAASTLFVFTSLTETQGVVVSEAQSFGLPCVLMRGGGASEFVRPDEDAVVTAPEVGVFAQAIRALLDNNGERRRLAQNALNNPLRPTPEGMAQTLLRLYRDVSARMKTGKKGASSPLRIVNGMSQGSDEPR